PRHDRAGPDARSGADGDAHQHRGSDADERTVTDDDGLRIRHRLLQYRLRRVFVTVVCVTDEDPRRGEHVPPERDVADARDVRVVTDLAAVADHQPGLDALDGLDHGDETALEDDDVVPDLDAIGAEEPEGRRDPRVLAEGAERGRGWWVRVL